LWGKAVKTRVRATNQWRRKEQKRGGDRSRKGEENGAKKKGRRQEQ